MKEFIDFLVKPTVIVFIEILLFPVWLFMIIKKRSNMDKFV